MRTGDCILQTLITLLIRWLLFYVHVQVLWCCPRLSDDKSQRSKIDQASPSPRNQGHKQSRLCARFVLPACLSIRAVKRQLCYQNQQCSKYGKQLQEHSAISSFAQTAVKTAILIQQYSATILVVSRKASTCLNRVEKIPHMTVQRICRMFITVSIILLY